MEAEESAELFGSLMEAENFIELCDSLWFERGILKRQVISFNSYSEANPRIQQQQGSLQKPEILRIPTTISRSMSERLDCKTAFSSAYSMSPDSALVTAKLKTILSGKLSTEKEEKESPVSCIQGAHVVESPKKTITRRRRRGKNTASKSLSELEYDELKGFMDLGFVFSEEDKDSSLVSIIPGLQRLGNNNGSDQEKSQVVGSTISRPYLSEAWEVSDSRDVNPLMNWRIPALTSEFDMKHNLKWWAHTVASTVR